MAMQAIAEQPVSRPVPGTLDELYAEAERLHIAVGWLPRKTPIMGSKPRSEFHAHRWEYAAVHDALESTGTLIDVALAERRNLILRNPKPDNEWATSRTLVCAYQMILPGEAAPSHRHTSNALRVIIDGEGSYSIVDGEKMPMESGDVVLTPGGHWHGHGHEGDAPAYWLDCLDVPLTYLLEPMYYEHHPEKYEPVQRRVDASPFRFSREDIARALDAASPDDEGRYGSRITLPTPSMPSVGLAVERIESGVKRRGSRSKANRIFSVMSGRGRSVVEGQSMTWDRGDTIVVPSSHALEHHAAVDATLVEMSDEPLMRFTNHYAIEWL